MAERVVPGRRAAVATRRRRLGLIAAGVVLVTVGVVAATYSPLFGARSVRVEGNARLSAGEVTSIAGVGEGTNVVHLDAAEVETRLEADPWIAAATVARDLPTTIVLTIDERRPVATVDGDVVADDATVLPGAEGRGLPAIEAVAGILGAADVAAGAAAAGAMPQEVRSRLETILVEPDDDLVLTMDDGVTVFYGLPGEDAAKAEALRAILEWSAEQGVAIRAADVSVPAAPTARPVDGTSTPIP